MRRFFPEQNSAKRVDQARPGIAWPVRILEPGRKRRGRPTSLMASAPRRCARRASCARSAASLARLQRPPRRDRGSCGCPSGSFALCIAIHQYAMSTAQTLLRSSHDKAPSDSLDTALPSRVWILSRASARRGAWKLRIAVTVNMRSCLVCGRPSPGPRCREHEIPRRGWQHQQARAQVLAEEWLCWRCGKPGTLADPLTADHVIPRAHGGADARHNMRAAHSSCNKRAGATQVGARINPDRRNPLTDSGNSASESFPAVIL